MANLKATDEEWAKLEELERAERVATEYGRAVDDLLFRTVRDLAEARAGLRRNEKRISDADVRANQDHWRQEHLIQRIEQTALWIQEDHLKRVPAHKKRLVRSVEKGCDACALILELAKYVAHQKREIAR